MNNIKIFLISGSIRNESYTRKVTDYIADTLKQKGIDICHWDFLNKPLPMMIPELREDVSNHPDVNVREFEKQASECDAFVFASPIYHNSFSGILKNAIDHLRNRHFTYKPIGLVSHGGDHSKQAVDQLRIVARGLGAVATPTIVCVDEDDFQGYELTNEEIIARVERFSEELVLFAKTMQSLRAEKIAKDK